MNNTSLVAAFEEWWMESYGRSPGVHAVMTHTAFAQHILSLLEHSPQQPEDGSPL
jgi:hypothetical protein